MPDEQDPLDPLHEASFLEGQEALAKSVSVRRLKEFTKSMDGLGDVVAESINHANDLAKDGDPHKERLAAIIKNAILGAVDELTTGQPQAQEGREAIEVTPLSNGSTPSTASLPSSPPKQLEHEASEPPKRKRGRPPKNARG